MKGISFLGFVNIVFFCYSNVEGLTIPFQVELPSVISNSDNISLYINNDKIAFGKLENQYNLRYVGKICDFNFIFITRYNSNV